MLDQTFTAENFRKILDLENRKGHYIEGRFFPAIALINEQIKSTKTQLYSARRDRKLDNETRQATIQQLRTTLQLLVTKRETDLTDALDQVASTVTSKGFRIHLKEVPLQRTKTAYSLPDTASAYFVSKQLQHNVHRLYGVRQADRNTIIKQLLHILEMSYPKTLIKTDIKSFYENIPRSGLLKRLETDALLSYSSQKLVRTILYEYGLMTGKDVGIPRGVGLSSYLAELYMRDIDHNAHELPSLIFYARYVDDIIAVFADNKMLSEDACLDSIRGVVTGHGLTLNEENGKTIKLRLDKNTSASFDYLGYRMRLAPGHVKVELSTKRECKYKRRIELCFHNYSVDSFKNEPLARKLLINRIKFLTTNTRLANRKECVLVGAYFSNSLLTNSGALKCADAYLRYKIDSLSCEILKSQLRRYSFVAGFEQRTFTKFTPNALKLIVKAWKYHE